MSPYKLFLNGIIAGSIYVLVALCFTVIYSTVKFFHIRHNLSQGQLAKEIGVTQQYISKIEEGEFSNAVVPTKL